MSAPQTAQKQQKNTAEVKATKQSNETKQRKQQHYFHSQNCRKRQKKQKKNVKHQQKIIPNEMNTQEKPKKTKGRQEDKTVQRCRTTFSQASCQHDNKKFRFQ